MSVGPFWLTWCILGPPFLLRLTQLVCVVSTYTYSTLSSVQERVKEAKHKLKRIDRTEEKYELSRWTPVVKDIAEVNIWLAFSYLFVHLSVWCP